MRIAHTHEPCLAKTRNILFGSLSGVLIGVLKPRLEHVYRHRFDHFFHTFKLYAATFRLYAITFRLHVVAAIRPDGVTIRLHRAAGIDKMQLQHLDSREGFEADFVFPANAFLIEIFPDAPACIATHHRLRTVGIENAHAEIGGFLIFRLSDQHQTVTTNTGVSRAPCYRSRLRIGHAI